MVNVAKFIGVDTVGSSMKNANRDIRGTIPNPKFNVSVWHNSSIDPDYNHKGLSIWYINNLLKNKIKINNL